MAYESSILLPSQREGEKDFNSCWTESQTKVCATKSVFMSRKQLLFAVFALIAGAAVLFAISNWRGSARRGRPAFVQTDGPRLVIDGRPFRFVGTNIAVMYRDDDRARMPETLQQAARIGIK